MKRSQVRQWSFLITCVILVALVLWMRSLPVSKSIPKSGDADLASGFLARKERWATKTGAGEGASGIDIVHPQQATVSELIALERPPDLPARGGPGGDRFGPVEHTVYVIDAEVVRYKQEEEDDQDYHIVIRDWEHPGKTMIVEIPDPRAVDPSSPWRSQIVEARREFALNFEPTGRFKTHRGHVRVVGVGFFDFLHGQSGVAPNGIELHPVLKIEVLN